MKKILDRLLARQSRLMAQLDDRPAVPPAAEAASQALPTPPALSPAERQRLGEDEITALSKVDALLSAGSVSAAADLLAPFETYATQPRTLTLLARVAMLQGDSERSVSLLRRAEALDPMDQATWRLLADHMMRAHRFEDELAYRRKLALFATSSPASAQVALIRALVRASGRWVPGAALEIRAAVKRLEEAAGATVDHCAEAAEAVYTIVPMADEARQLYARALPCAPAQRDVTATWMSMAAWCERAGLEIRRDEQAGQPGRRPQAAALRDVIVGPMLAWTPVLDDGRAILTGFERTTVPLHRFRAASPVLMTNVATAELRLPGDIAVESRPALLLGGHPDPWRHAVDCLGALAVAESFGLGDGLPLVVHADLSPFQRAQLLSLGYDQERLIYVAEDRLVRFEQLLVPTRLSSASTWVDPMLPAWFRRRLAPTAGSAATRRLMLRADDAIENHAEVFGFLAPLGYEQIDPEATAHDDLCEAFAAAAEVVAPLGPSLAHLLLSPAGARVTVLCGSAPDPAELARHEALAQACGHRVQFVRCDAAEGSGRLELRLPTLRLALAGSGP